MATDQKRLAQSLETAMNADTENKKLLQETLDYVKSFNGGKAPRQVDHIERPSSTPPALPDSELGRYQ